MDRNHARLLAFSFGFTAVMLGIILYHTLLNEEIARARYVRLRRQINDGLDELASDLGVSPTREADLTPATEPA